MVTLSIIKGYSPLQPTKLKTSLFCHPFFFSTEITKFVKKTFLRNMIIYNFFEVFKIPQIFKNFFLCFIVFEIQARKLFNSFLNIMTDQR